MPEKFPIGNAVGAVLCAVLAGCSDVVDITVVGDVEVEAGAGVVPVTLPVVRFTDFLVVVGFGLTDVADDVGVVVVVDTLVIWTLVLRFVVEGIFVLRLREVVFLLGVCFVVV